MNLVPDFILRAGIRYLLRTKCLFNFANTEDELKAEIDFVKDLRTRAVAEQTKAANEQHYEVPTEFYLLCLGSNLKYSCCLYDKPGMTLDEAELAMLQLYGQRAELANGQNILELGCGWGSLSLWMAKTYPLAKVTGVSELPDAEGVHHGAAARSAASRTWRSSLLTWSHSSPPKLGGTIASSPSRCSST